MVVILHGVHQWLKRLFTAFGRSHDIRIQENISSDWQSTVRKDFWSDIVATTHTLFIPLLSPETYKNEEIFVLIAFSSSIAPRFSSTEFFY